MATIWRLYHRDGALLAIQKEGCLYLEQTHWPYSDRTTDETGDVDFTDLATAFDHMMWSKVGTPPAPIGYDPQGLAELAAGARAFRGTTDRAIIGLFGGSLLEGGQQLFRMDNFLAMLAGEKALTHRFLDRLVEYYLDRLRKYLSGSRAVHRHHPLWRRSWHADRPTDLAAHVPRVFPAASKNPLERGQETVGRQDYAPFLRWALSTAAGPDRGRVGDSPARPDHLQEHGA